VLWCGNNEVEQLAPLGDRIEFKKKLTKDQQENVWQNYLLIMNDVLKGVVLQHSPDVPYTPSSHTQATTRHRMLR